MPDYADLLEKNRRYLWNPFTQMQEYLAEEPVIVERAQGVRLTDVRGREYLDGNSSLWVNVHGHNHPDLNRALIDQLGRVAHTTLLGSANVPAIELAERLVTITPPGLDKVFYSDSGATAVEIGLKIAFAYWQRAGQPQRSRFVTMRNAYHGDTIGSVSLGMSEAFHAEFRPLLFGCDQVPYPDTYRFDGTAAECGEHCLAVLAAHLERHGAETGCLVVEPLVQGAAGMITMPDGFLSGVERLCRAHGVLLFADEVATGFGRTGRMFACEHEGVRPDLMAVAKGLTGGYLPVAATLASDALYKAFLGDLASRRTFYHGHSYTGNQLGCAVALASLDVFEREHVVLRAAALGEHLGRGLEPIAAAG
jgi:adenosylmethionine---8-amino-7-oxononanoate aminotransferase